jgi:hypothetical protein
MADPWLRGAQVDTRDILFIVGGAFIDLERQLMETRHEASIGFGNKARARAAAGASEPCAPRPVGRGHALASEQARGCRSTPHA